MKYFKFISSKFTNVSLDFLTLYLMDQKVTTFDHDFYVDVGKQCRTENA